MITPLGADLATAVEESTDEIADAYGQIFSLLNSGISAGILLGPSLAGALYEAFGWVNMVLVLAAISTSALLPIVSITVFLEISLIPTRYRSRRKERYQSLIKASQRN